MNKETRLCQPCQPDPAQTDEPELPRTLVSVPRLRMPRWRWDGCDHRLVPGCWPESAPPPPIAIAPAPGETGFPEWAFGDHPQPDLRALMPCSGSVWRLSGQAGWICARGYRTAGLGFGPNSLGAITSTLKSPGQRSADLGRKRSRAFRHNPGNVGAETLPPKRQNKCALLPGTPVPPSRSGCGRPLNAP
jgi:hypothetical protein